MSVLFHDHSLLHSVECSFEDELERFLKYSTSNICFRVYFGSNINFHIDLHKCGKAFPINGTAIQTSIGTLRRVSAIITCFWVTGVSLGFINSFWSYRLSCVMGIGLSASCVVISIFSYTRIFLRLRQRQNHNQSQTNRRGTVPLNIARYKRTVSTIAWVQLAMVVCYVPMSVSVGLIETNEWRGTISSDIVWRSTITLLFLNSSLNPILYRWKIREVKKAVKNTVKNLYCLSSYVRCRCLSS